MQDQLHSNNSTTTSNNNLLATQTWDPFMKIFDLPNSIESTEDSFTQDFNFELHEDSDLTEGSECGSDGSHPKSAVLYKTEMCDSFMTTGHCRYGKKCKFAHGEKDLRPVTRHPKYKTTLCKNFWDQGFCPYGKRCCFVHFYPQNNTHKDDLMEMDHATQPMGTELQSEFNPFDNHGFNHDEDAELMSMSSASSLASLKASVPDMDYEDSGSETSGEHTMTMMH